MKFLVKIFITTLLVCSLIAGTPQLYALAIPPIRPDVLLDAGHGGIDGGTLYGKVLEKDINLAIARKTYTALQKKGYHVVLNRTKDYALSEDNGWLQNRSRHIRDLAQRKQLANELQPRVMVSLHVNWSKSTSTSGPMIIYQNNQESKLLAHILQRKLNNYYHTEGEPILGRTYYLLNYTKCPTVIIEMGFISNPNDRRKLTNSAEQAKIASGISDAINEYFHHPHP